MKELPEIEGKIILAPMAGVTTLPYREFMKPYGVGLSFTEMISDCGIYYGNNNTYRYIKTSDQDSPCGLQLFGSDIEISKKAVEILESKTDYDVLDINMGCPVLKVTKTGAGSAMMKDPERAYNYLREIVKVSSKPVTAKIRLGWDHDHMNYEEVIKIIEAAGCKGFAIHARTKSQGYEGTANYEELRDLKSKTSLKFAISGDIFSAEAAEEAMNITGADYVMVARGAMGNPWLIKDINHYLKTGEHIEAATLLDQVFWAEKFANMLIAYEGERIAVPQLRGLLPHFFNGFPGYKKIRRCISEKCKTKEDLEQLFAGIRDRGQL